METSENNFVYVLIAGGREFRDTDWMRRQIEAIVLRSQGSTVRIIHGGARGADRLAGECALSAGLEVGVFGADWDRYGKSAGYRRNERMARFLVRKRQAGAHVEVVLFPGGKGTEHMRNIAKRSSLPVYQPVAKTAPSVSKETVEDDRTAAERWEDAYEAYDQALITHDF
jgi:hypothetical protein